MNKQASQFQHTLFFPYSRNSGDRAQRCQNYAMTNLHATWSLNTPEGYDGDAKVIFLTWKRLDTTTIEALKSAFRFANKGTSFNGVVTVGENEEVK